MFCAIWQHLYNLRNVKNTHVTFSKVTSWLISVMQDIVFWKHYDLFMKKEYLWCCWKKFETLRTDILSRKYQSRFKHFTCPLLNTLFHLWNLILTYETWDKVFKNGPSKIRGEQPLKNLKWYGLPHRPYHLEFFKGCPPEILLDSFLNNLPHMILLKSKCHY